MEIQYLLHFSRQKALQMIGLEFNQLEFQNQSSQSIDKQVFEKVDAEGKNFSFALTFIYSNSDYWSKLSSNQSNLVQELLVLFYQIYLYLLQLCPILCLLQIFQSVLSFKLIKILAQHQHFIFPFVLEYQPQQSQGHQDQHHLFINYCT